MSDILQQLQIKRNYAGVEGIMELVPTLDMTHLPPDFEELADLVKAQQKALKKFDKEYKLDPDSQVGAMFAREGRYYTLTCKTSPKCWYRPRHPIYRAWQRVQILNAEIEDFCGEYLNKA